MPHLLNKSALENYLLSMSVNEKCKNTRVLHMAVKRSNDND